jgi:hypothetical protein
MEGFVEGRGSGAEGGFIEGLKRSCLRPSVTSTESTIVSDMATLVVSTAQPL